VTVSPIRDEDGKVLGASAMVRDTTAQRRAERALLSSEARGRAIIETAVDARSNFGAIHIVGRDGSKIGPLGLRQCGCRENGKQETDDGFFHGTSPRMAETQASLTISFGSANDPSGYYRFPP